MTWGGVPPPGLWGSYDERWAAAFRFAQDPGNSAGASSPGLVATKPVDGVRPTFVALDEVTCRADGGPNQDGWWCGGGGRGGRLFEAEVDASVDGLRAMIEQLVAARVSVACERIVVERYILVAVGQAHRALDEAQQMLDG